MWTFTAVASCVWAGVGGGGGAAERRPSEKGGRARGGRGERGACGNTVSLLPSHQKGQNSLSLHKNIRKRQLVALRLLTVGANHIYVYEWELCHFSLSRVFVSSSNWPFLWKYSTMIALTWNIKKRGADISELFHPYTPIHESNHALLGQIYEGEKSRIRVICS